MKPRNQIRPPGWEAELDRKLRSLPDRPAPRTLIPRVLTALHAQAVLPWYRRPWWNWPPAAQVLSLLVLSGLLGMATWLVIHAGRVDWAAAFMDDAKRWLAPLAPVWSLLSALAGAVALVLKGAGGWVPAAGTGLCLVMYLSCIGLGTVFYRVAFSRRNL